MDTSLICNVIWLDFYLSYFLDHILVSFQFFNSKIVFDKQNKNRDKNDYLCYELFPNLIN